MPQTELSPDAALGLLLGKQAQQIQEQQQEITTLKETIEKMRDWARSVEERLPKKRKYTAPETTIKAEEVERAYRIIRNATGRNYQADSVYGKQCRNLMAKHGVDRVCQVMAYACRRNGEKGSQEWSKPSTLFRPANFARWLDEMVAQKSG